ncbi:hypothetical protein LCGC14_2185270 [marine sediment metagenome]|uniref:YgiT-type zinc finger domain-containing protein n=1 Tax=marine sediment metagenome TaxID=412755 RepID=A0A0F9GGY7_9ZZZZ
MKCVVCKSDDINKKSVDEELKRGTDIVFVPVEVLVCNSCGERYYDRKTMQFLEDIGEKIRDEKISLSPVGKVLKVSI